MDINLTNYGWSGQADCSINIDNNISFDTEGYIINENTYLDNEMQYEIIAKYEYAGLDIGLILWYNQEIGYVKYIVKNETVDGVEKTTATLERIKGSDARILGKRSYDGNLSGVVTLKAVVHGTNIRCYINDIEYINAEQRFTSSGYFGLYASMMEVCSEFSINAKGAEGWVYDLNSGGSIDASDAPWIHIRGAGGFKTNIKQSLELEPGKYTLSFDYTGSADVKIQDEVNVVIEDSFSSAPPSRAVLSFEVISASQITIIIGTSDVLSVSKPQLENKDFDTSYTLGSKTNSSMTFPAKDMNIKAGGIAMLFSPTYDYADPSKTMPLVYYSDEFYISYNNGKLTSTYGTATQERNIVLEEGEFYYLYFTWDSEKQMTLGISSIDESIFSYGTSQMSGENIEEVDYVYIGSTPSSSGNMLIDNLIVMKNEVTLTELENCMTDESLMPENMVTRATFNKETLICNENLIVLPSPKPGSPIIIEKSNGDTYERVCFVKSGKYSVFNTEQFIYDGAEEFELSATGILEIEASIPSSGIIIADGEISLTQMPNGKTRAILGGKRFYTELNEYSGDPLGEFIGLSGKAYESDTPSEFSDLVIRKSSTGEKIEIPDEYIIRSVDGYTVFIKSEFLDGIDYDYTVIDDYLSGNEIFFEYSLKDSYCINYNKDYDQYEISLSNVDDSNLKVQYEEDAGLDRRVIRTVELNPFKSTNNTGFIYIEDVPRELETFDIKITPDSVMADGFDTATISIDCYSKSGATTSNVDLDITSKHGYGSIERYVDDIEKEWLIYRDLYGKDETIARYGDLVTEEHRSGRFIYKYTAKMITDKGYEIIDQLIIKDRISKIGIQVPIRLVRGQ